MTDKPTLHTGVPERRVVHAWEGEVDGLRTEIERLRKEVDQLRAENVALRAEIERSWKDEP